MAKVLGICNLHDSPHLGRLTHKRSLGAVTFIGRYALMDFTLSNFSNSSIDRAIILVDQFANSVRNHVRNGSVWINNTRTGFQRLWVNETFEGNQKFNTDINNILYNMSSFQEMHEDFIVFAPSFFLMNIDFSPIIKKHAESGADVTLIYKPINNAKSEFVNCDTLELKKDKIVSVGSNVGQQDDANISLESFVVSREKFLELIENARSISSLFSFRQLITYLIGKGEIKTKGYKFTGYVAPILSQQHYVRESFKLMDYNNRKQLFDNPDWPIYTTTHNTPPVLYGQNAKVSNSFIANGSVINGTVKNSIISRDVVVNEGATVENCIIFTGSEIGSDVKLKYVVTDKSVKVSNFKKLEGEENNIIFIEQGSNV